MQQVSEQRRVAKSGAQIRGQERSDGALENVCADARLTTVECRDLSINRLINQSISQYLKYSRVSCLLLMSSERVELSEQRL